MGVVSSLSSASPRDMNTGTRIATPITRRRTGQNQAPSEVTASIRSSGVCGTRNTRPTRAATNPEMKEMASNLCDFIVLFLSGSTSDLDVDVAQIDRRIEDHSPCGPRVVELQARVA